jgi:hypothetical protein
MERRSQPRRCGNPEARELCENGRSTNSEERNLALGAELFFKQASRLYLCTLSVLPTSTCRGGYSSPPLNTPWNCSYLCAAFMMFLPTQQESPLGCQTLSVCPLGWPSAEDTASSYYS